MVARASACRVETRLDPCFPAPTEDVGMSADAAGKSAGKSACATPTVTQIREAE
jgi:hypothetical protein